MSAICQTCHKVVNAYRYIRGKLYCTICDVDAYEKQED